MMKVRFIRPAPYDYRLPKSDLYSSYNEVAKGLAEPTVSTASIPLELSRFLTNAQILSSEASRTKQTAAMLGKNFRTSPLLNEIGYSMEQLIAKDEFDGLGAELATTKARKRFFPAFFANKLSESRESAIERAIKLIEHLLASGKTVAVSHGFFMKFFEVIVLHPEAAQDIRLFSMYYDGSKPAYDFLDGPEFSDKQLKLALEHLSP